MMITSYLLKLMLKTATQPNAMIERLVKVFVDAEGLLVNSAKLALKNWLPSMTI